MGGFSDLAAGLYQMATPDEIKVIENTVVLREDQHFWADRKRQQDAQGQWVDVVMGLHVNTVGLRVQAEAIGAHVTARIVEQDRQYCRALGTGYRLRPDGMLEVFSSEKEYDMAVELAKAALKELSARQAGGAPVIQQTEEMSTALVRPMSEETALAVAGQLPPMVKVKVMQARFEVQAHRLGLCETKAENRVLRYFVGGAGGVLKAKPGCGEVKVTLRQALLMRRLDPEQVRASTQALYGPPAGAVQITVEPAAPEEPREENGQIVGEERADASEHDAGAEEGPDAPEGGPDPDQPLDVQPEPAEPEAPAQPVPMERYALLDAFAYALKQLAVEFHLPAQADLTEEAADNIAASMRVAFGGLTPNRRKAATDIFRARCKDLDVKPQWPWPEEPKAAEGGGA